MQDSFFEFHPDGLTFESKEAARHRMIYAPLCGPKSSNLKSAITPILSGDIKLDKFTYLTKPASREDLRYPARNFYLNMQGPAFAGVGASLLSVALDEHCDSKVTVGPLWHRLTRDYLQEGLKVEVLNFIPCNGDNLELMHVRVTNVSPKSRTFLPTSAVPLFARALVNKHDHEHVTALLHRIEQIKEGVIVSPTMIFDEKEHMACRHVYFVFGADSKGENPVGSFPTFENFYGENGDIGRPESLMQGRKPEVLPETMTAGKEAIGALRFSETTLNAGEAADYMIGVGIAASRGEALKMFQRYRSMEQLQKVWKDNQDFWSAKAQAIAFKTADKTFNSWMHWVTLQPVFRRIFGCSFLPDHDYGKGGKGWRDLWQDLLSLILIEPESVRESLINNFAGVRIDGSNATIIGAKFGEFVADRNAITRVWMDHGAWPLMTILLYVNQTGDYKILFEDNTYFRDPQLSRTFKKDKEWNVKYGHQLKDVNGNVYRGTLLEHLLLQNLVQFFNVGEHNITRLESADWNDGLEMAFERGESVAFMSFYAGNLLALASLLEQFPEKLGIREIKVFKELQILLDTLACHSCESRNPVSFEDKTLDPSPASPAGGLRWDDKYNDATYKSELLFDQYFDAVQPEISGETVNIPVGTIAEDLRVKGRWMMERIRKQEKISVEEKGQTYRWFNGYYDNASRRVEGLHHDHVRMTLTGAVFAIMHDAAEDSDVRDIIRCVDHYLKDPRLGGIRLNSDFHLRQYPDFGRAFAFAFGTKENGAFFSHMTVMYAYALYKRGFVKEGHDVLQSIYRMSMDGRRSKIYPGIPEYFDSEGRGMYPYLTGSASWLVLTELTQVFGVRGESGDLVIAPKLVKGEFVSSAEISISSHFAGQKIKVVYANPQKLDYGQYAIGSVTLNGEKVAVESAGSAIKIPRAVLQKHAGECVIRTELTAVLKAPRTEKVLD